MAEQMVERVAEAIHKQRSANLGEVAKPWSTESPGGKDYTRGLARAAIETMQVYLDENYSPDDWHIGIDAALRE